MLKATGIVRRVDELGRVVIPKEIRKVNNWREGDSLEIFVDDDAKVILKKYSPIASIVDINSYVESLAEVTGLSVIATDSMGVISSANIANEASLELSKEVLEAIEAGEDVQFQAPIRKGGKSYSLLVAPVIRNNDSVGAVILISNREIREPDAKAASLIANIIGSRMAG
ncbi:AbrB family transcriptional regulator (stage V sporulation protein T) [Hydrogenispora ethanolica]|jgi:AbrB family transcriptional regulator (stage V sporulation protein T)|uniref:AbrB family transcriptional regulator (Stage V sporulation protein T) n=1 Tax=Hydrogenispora ethanolica TaxID=1082276 RepID=A0A4R1S501_HYDET|nr:AbrB/MazE/SpoVT family DNA-binding domain-containing protein [Hydrogenispora ethanolica]TCL74199.1 AbrB family transcriptional regulator (stage V sporulation protein T) [Hydrogenispora ethanolica]